MFDKYLKKAGGHIGRNVVEITIKSKTIVRKPLMIKTVGTVSIVKIVSLSPRVEKTKSQKKLISVSYLN